MGSAVLDALRSRAELPPTGVLAGQAVASALEDCFGRGGGVYNDIDVFRQLPTRAPSRERTERIAPTLSMCALAVSRMPEPGAEEYDHLKLIPTLVTQETYRIERTVRRDALNTVLYRANGIPNADPLRVLRGFDLNCVRVGVDLQTRRLVWTPEYEAFLRTSELRLCAAHTPFHSLLRMLKKREELADVTLPLEASLSIAALMALPEPRRTLQERRAATFWYGSKYQALARTHRAALGAAFRIETHLLRKGERGALVRGAGDETSDAALFGTLVPRSAPASSPQRPLPTLSANPRLDVHRLPGLVYQAFDAPSARARVSVSGWSALARPGSQAAPFVALQGERYLAGWRARDSVVRLEKGLGEAPAELMLHRSAREQLLLLDQVHEAVRASGAPDTAHLVRATLVELASESGLEPAQACQQVIRLERGQRLSRMAAAFEVREPVWRAHLTHPRAQLQRLESMRDAREFAQRHGWNTLLEDVPLLSGLVLAGSGARHPRDVAVLCFETDAARTGLEWRFQVHRRTRMPAVHVEAWLGAILALFEDAREQGAVLPFSPMRR